MSRRPTIPPRPQSTAHGSPSPTVQCCSRAPGDVVPPRQVARHEAGDHVVADHRCRHDEHPLVVPAPSLVPLSGESSVPCEPTGGIVPSWVPGVHLLGRRRCRRTRSTLWVAARCRMARARSGPVLADSGTAPAARRVPSRQPRWSRTRWPWALSSTSAARSAADRSQPSSRGRGSAPGSGGRPPGPALSSGRRRSPGAPAARRRPARRADPRRRPRRSRPSRRRRSPRR